MVPIATRVFLFFRPAAISVHQLGPFSDTSSAMGALCAVTFLHHAALRADCTYPWNNPFAASRFLLVLMLMRQTDLRSLNMRVAVMQMMPITKCITSV